ncbi:MAG: hypothetical protein OEU54_09950 [Gemmatimonadota bacterium]|nr:hypothetical protein [Gemmatimonadota bacterium]
MSTSLVLQEIPGQLPAAELPLGIPFTRWFFGASQGVQIAILSAAALLILAGLALAIRKRRPLTGWFQSRGRLLRVGLVVGGLVLLISTVGAGRASWHYMQHDNDFCTGCHVMGSAFQRFTDSGHAELNCHDCHQQSIFASARQLREWVRDRPEEIGEHSPVPNEICADCHVDDDPNEDWAQIAATAGHVAHLESDSSSLAGLQCVTCHGQEVHQFLPADQTCAQADCHAAESAKIVLGRMSDETGLHCVTCHEFTADPIVPTAVDSVTGLLSPGLRQCTSCHEMDVLWESYDPLLDPHDAECGACHNPHEQETPELALRSCTDAGCHARPDTLSTFHIGLGEAMESDCTSCHQPHIWVRDGNDCAACHTDIPGAVALGPSGPRGVPASVFHTPAPAGRTGQFHLAATTEVTLTSFRHLAPPARLPAGSAGSRPRSDAEALAAHAPPPQQQPFTHNDHVGVVCTGCHSNARQHGEVTVRTQSECFACHHSTSTASTQGCGDCHAPAALGRSRLVTSTLRMSVWEEPRVRALPFDHDGHTSLRCVDCHGGGTRQQVQTTCANCHEDHHQPEALADCVSCHEEHREDAHTAEVHTDGCTGAGCHTEPRFERMDRTREFCATCHQEWIDHEPQAPCIECHLVPSNGAAGVRGRE